MRMRFALFSFAGSMLIVSAAFANGPSGFPPYFSERSPETVIVNLNLGQNSFLCTGTARDFDAGDTVYIFSAPLPPFMTLDVINGNPATFRLHAENLTLANYGGYAVDVLARETPNGPAEDSVRFAIGIIPEPTSLVCGPLSFMLMRRRR